MKKIVQTSRTESDETHRLDTALAKTLGRRSFAFNLSHNRLVRC